MVTASQIKILYLVIKGIKEYMGVFFLSTKFQNTRSEIRIQRGSYQRRMYFSGLCCYYIMSYLHEDIKGKKTKGNKR